MRGRTGGGIEPGWAGVDETRDTWAQLLYDDNMRSCEHRCHVSGKAFRITFVGSCQAQGSAHDLLDMDPSARICSPKTTSAKAVRAFEPAAQPQVSRNQVRDLTVVLSH